ncbi:hypothetical protein BLOT_009543, partial [Blomia tropicalis]
MKCLGSPNKHKWTQNQDRLHGCELAGAATISQLTNNNSILSYIPSYRIVSYCNV